MEVEKKQMGFVLLWRAIQNNHLWLAEPFTKGQAWIDMFMLANHKDGILTIRGNVVPIKRGQLGWSIERLSERWKWSKDKVGRYFSMLRTSQQISIQKSHIISIITILKYEEYQKDSTQTSTQTSPQTGFRQGYRQVANNNGNNGNNENNYSEPVKNLSPVLSTPVKRQPTEGEWSEIDGVTVKFVLGRWINVETQKPFIKT